MIGNFLQSSTSTGYFSNSTSSSATNCQFPPIIGTVYVSHASDLLQFIYEESISIIELLQVNSEVDSSLIDQHLSLAIFLLYLCDEPGFYSIFIQRSIEAQAAIQTLEQSAHLQWSISSNLTNWWKFCTLHLT
jgi:hypothetical protein